MLSETWVTGRRVFIRFLAKISTDEKSAVMVDGQLAAVWKQYCNRGISMQNLYKCHPGRNPAEESNTIIAVRISIPVSLPVLMQVILTLKLLVGRLLSMWIYFLS